MPITLFDKLGNNIDINHINLKCLCAKCDKDIKAGSYHLIIHLNFKYYGRDTKYFSETKRKKVLGTLRLHFDCFEKMAKELINLNEELEKLKIDLVAKVL